MSTNSPLIQENNEQVTPILTSKTTPNPNTEPLEKNQ